MSRKSKTGGDTRERILDAAMTVFMEKGYEEASVRTIIERSGAVTGSFYHFFSSKEALFEAVIERYLSQYAQRIAVLADDSQISAAGQLDSMLDEIERAAQTYFGSLQAGKLHWTVQYALHDKTMQAILPSVERMVEKALLSGRVKSRLNVDAQTLSAVLLRGVEAILHARPMEELNARQLAQLKSSVKAYVALLLEICPEE